MSNDRRFSSWISYHDPILGRVYRNAPDDTPGRLRSCSNPKRRRAGEPPPFPPAGAGHLFQPPHRRQRSRR